MLKLQITLDEIDYEGLVKSLFPLIFKHTLTCKALTFTALNRLKNKTDKEKSETVASFINEHKEAIIDRITNEADALGIKIKITDLYSDTK